jgi:hypothetical protein
MSMIQPQYRTFTHLPIRYSNMTSFFPFVNKRASYPFGIISLAHAPVNVIDFSKRGIKFTYIRQSMLKLETHPGFHDFFRF